MKAESNTGNYNTKSKRKCRKTTITDREKRARLLLTKTLSCRDSDTTNKQKTELKESTYIQH